jgi:hypothetical protein
LTKKKKTVVKKRLRDILDENGADVMKTSTPGVNYTRTAVSV